ncbi:MAG: sporulation protein [Chloroflexaceae bacterium]|jgi:sporulation-control protein|nr:sporulation protein [Chloroflexaceae bacterium]
MFKKLFAAMGVGSAEVDTRLHNTIVTPGGKISGEVFIKGGTATQEIEQLTLFLMTKVEVESGDHEHTQGHAISRWPIARDFKIFANETTNVPFEFYIHPETPVTDIPRGAYQPAGGLFGKSSGSSPQPQSHTMPQTAMMNSRVWIHTGLEIDNGVDATDRDALVVRPTEPMMRFFAALENIGFTLHSADVEKGTLRGNGFQSTIGCYQELEYRPAYGQNHGIQELEISFVTRPNDTGVLIEIDRRFGHGGDSYRSLTMHHSNYQQVNWEEEIRRAISNGGRGPKW